MHKWMNKFEYLFKVTIDILQFLYYNMYNVQNSRKNDRKFGKMMGENYV